MLRNEPKLEFSDDDPFTQIPDELLLKIFEFLNEQDDPFNRVDYSSTSKQWYELLNDAKTLNEILSSCSIQQLNDLFWKYMAEGSAKTKIVLMAKNIDVNSKKIEDQTPLYIACSQQNLKLVQLLVENNANLEATSITSDGDEYKPLHIAIKKGYADIVKFLVEAGADVNSLTNRAETPLDLACKSQFDRVSIAAYLLQKIAKNNKDNKLTSSLFYAVANANLELVKLLIENGADINAVIEKKGNTITLFDHAKNQNNFSVAMKQVVDYLEKTQQAQKNYLNTINQIAANFFTEAARIKSSSGFDGSKKATDLQAAIDRAMNQMSQPPYPLDERANRLQEIFLTLSDGNQPSVRDILLGKYHADVKQKQKSIFGRAFQFFSQINNRLENSDNETNPQQTRDLDDIAFTP